MPFRDPPRQWQSQQHQRILRQDPTAFAELCEIVIPQLVAFLRAGFPQHEKSLHETVVIDLLLDYHARPEQYDPRKLGLLAYFRMAAKRDMLNAIDRQRRYEKHLTDIDAPSVELEMPARNTLQEAVEDREWVEAHTNLSLEQILGELGSRLSAVEQQVLLLMLEGVRDTARYADVMGLTYMDISQQQLEVKRAKDRLVKKLQRFGRRIGKS